MKKLLLFVLCTVLNMALMGQTELVLINEIDSDTPGTDKSEFVELFNASDFAVDLTGYTLVLFNGSNNESYKHIDLSGYVIDTDGYLLIGSSGLNADIVISTSSWLQNGADAVALYRNGYAPTTPDTINLVDAVVYGTDDPVDTDLLVLLNNNEPQLNENGAANKDLHSLQRIPDGSGGARNTSSFIPSTPTPGAENESIELTYPTGGETITNDNPVNITWTATGMDSITIEGKKDTETEWTDIIEHAILASKGFYTISIKDVEEGDYSLRISDKLNYEVADSSDLFHINDVVFAGLYEDYPFYPENGSTGVPVTLPNNAMSMYFNESVQPGTGNIYLKKVADNSLIETFDVNDAKRVIFDEDEVHILLSSDLEVDTEYYVEVDNGAITDNAPTPNTFEGFAGSATWSFTTEEATMIKNTDDNSIVIGPNPVTNEMIISAQKPFIRIQILNYVGQIIVDKTINGQRITVPVAGMSKGIYLVRISFSDGTVKIKKVIKR